MTATLDHADAVTLNPGDRAIIVTDDHIEVVTLSRFTGRSWFYYEDGSWSGLEGIATQSVVHPLSWARTRPELADVVAAEDSRPPIQTWNQWRAWYAGVLARTYGITRAEAEETAGRHRDVWVSECMGAFNLGRDFTPQAIRGLPADVLHRITGTPRWWNSPRTAHPDDNPLRRYIDRLAVINGAL